jgi:hypothetical protein
MSNLELPEESGCTLRPGAAVFCAGTAQLCAIMPKSFKKYNIRYKT